MFTRPLASKPFLSLASSLSAKRGMAFVVVGNNDAFQKIEKNDKKKIFYFTASWCPPCKKIAPVFEKMAASHPTIDFCKVDVDDMPEAAGAYKVSGVPTFAFINKSVKVGQVVGADENGIRAKVLELEKL